MSSGETFHTVYRVFRCEVFILFPLSLQTVWTLKKRLRFIKFCSVLLGLYHYVYCYVCSFKSYFLTRGRHYRDITDLLSSGHFLSSDHVSSLDVHHHLAPDVPEAPHHGGRHGAALLALPGPLRQLGQHVFVKRGGNVGPPSCNHS